MAMIDCLTDEQVTTLCSPDNDELTHGIEGSRNQANHDFSYQGKFIEVWHEIRGLPMDKVKEKWVEAQMKGEIPPELVWQELDNNANL